MKRISLSRRIFAAFILVALSFQSVGQAKAADCPEDAAAAVTEARRTLAASDPVHDRHAIECLIEAVSTLEKTLTGLYINSLTRTASDTVVQFTGNAAGAEFIVKADGKVGIGTTSPTSLLDISMGETATGGILITDPNSTVARLADGCSTTECGWLALYDDSGAESIRLFANATPSWINTGGNLGIGTTTPDTSLSVRGGGVDIGGPFPSDIWSESSMLAIGASGTGGQAQGLIGHQGAHELDLFWNFYRNTGSTYAGLGTFGYTSANGIRMGDAGIVFLGTDTIGTTMPPINMTILNAGNVGIGTLAPNTKLEIVGPTLATFTGSTPGTLTLDHTYSDGSYQAIDFVHNSANLPFARIGVQHTGGGTFMSFGTSNNYGTGITNRALTINPAGSVGIGTAAPAYTLDITGTTRTTGNYYTNGSLLMGQDGTSTILYGSSAANQYMALYGAASNVTGASISLYGRTYSTTEGRISYYANTNTNDTTVAHYFLKISSGGTATSLMTIRSNGNMYVNGDYTCTIGTATTVSCTSDGRKKKDIETIPNALDSVVKLRGVTFRLKDPAKPQDQSLGFIAQEVMKVYPQAVRMGEDGYYTMEYAALVAPLVEAVKELKGLFDGLAEKVAGIITVNDDQSAQIEALKAANDNLRLVVEEQGREIGRLKAAQ